MGAKQINFKQIEEELQCPKCGNAGERYFRLTYKTIDAKAVERAECCGCKHEDEKSAFLKPQGIGNVLIRLVKAYI